MVHLHDDGYDLRCVQFLKQGNGSSVAVGPFSENGDFWLCHLKSSLQLPRISLQLAAACGVWKSRVALLITLFVV